MRGEQKTPGALSGVRRYRFVAGYGEKASVPPPARRNAPPSKEIFKRAVIPTVGRGCLTMFAKFAPPNVLTDDWHRHEAQLYGSEHAPHMAALCSEAESIVGRVVDRYHRNLDALPSIAQIVRSLSEVELRNAKAVQSSYLIALARPDLTAQTHARAARGAGLRNAILGVSREEIADSFGLLMSSLQNEFGSDAHAAALSTLAQRLMREVTIQLQVYAELQSARTDVLQQVTNLAWTVDSYADLIQSVTRIVGAHAEVAGCCVGRPDSHGVFRYESVFGQQTEDYIAVLEQDAMQRITIGDQPQGRGPTGQAWINRRIELSINLATDPRVATWRTSALAAGFRSSVAIPLCPPDGKPRAVMTLYRRLPGGCSNEQIAFVQQLQSLLAFALARIEEKNGRSRTVPYATRKRWSGLLRSKCLEMHYQPILDLQSGTISSVEALARLRDGDTLITPGQFLPTLTSEDLLVLFMQGLEQATRRLRVARCGFRTERHGESPARRIRRSTVFRAYPPRSRSGFLPASRIDARSPGDGRQPCWRRYPQGAQQVQEAWNRPRARRSWRGL